MTSQSRRQTRRLRLGYGHCITPPWEHNDTVALRKRLARLTQDFNAASRILARQVEHAANRARLIAETKQFGLTEQDVDDAIEAEQHRSVRTVDPFSWDRVDDALTRQSMIEAFL